MAFARFSFGLFAFLGLGLATACSSSSSSGASPDSGTPSGGPGSTTISPLADGGGGNPLGIMATCGLLSGGGGGTAAKCPSGQTCCTMLALPPSAACVPTGTCSGLSNECMSPSDCASGQVCCAGSADGGAMAAVDASTAGGLGGIPMIDPSQFSTTCQSSCTATQTQYCTMDTDCPSGLTCQAPPGAGALGGFIMLPNTCAAPRPDAGAATIDSGSAGEDSGSTPGTGSVDAAQE